MKAGALDQPLPAWKRPAIALLTGLAAATFSEPLAAAEPAMPDGASHIAPHEARYVVRAVKVAGSGYVGADGAMAMSLSRDCENWSMRQAYSVDLVPEQGDSLTIDRRFATTESLDGDFLTYEWRDYEDGGETEAARGAVTRTAEATFVASEGDEGERRLELPADTLFPVAHMAFLADAMERGDPIEMRPVFDGIDENGLAAAGFFTPLRGEQAQRRDALLAELGKEGLELAEQEAQTAYLSFFPLDDFSSVPDYEVHALLLQNGVVLRMVFDYGDLALAADLVDYVKGDTPVCEY